MDAFREAYLQLSNAIQNMEKELRSACHAPDAKVDNILKVSVWLCVNILRFLYD